MPAGSGWHQNAGQESNHPIHLIGNAADGLIEIDSLDQLNAVRYDLDGNGQPPNANSAAFPGRSQSRGCLDTTDADPGPCLGHELTANLDFDTNGGGNTHIGGVGDSTDTSYYNGGGVAAT